MIETFKLDWINLKLQLNLVCGNKLSKSYKILTVSWESEKELLSPILDTNISKIYLSCSKNPIIGIIMLLLSTINS